MEMKTGLLIKELRIKKGLTQEELAGLTELSARTIQRIENGEVDPRAYTLQMIAKALDVDFSLFVENVPGESQEFIKQNDINWLAFLHLSGLLPLIFPSVIVWNSKKDKTKNASIHFRAVIALQLSILGITLIGLWIYWKVNQPIPLFGGLLAGGIISIINALKVMNGAPFINPFIKNEDKN
jgi:transcriptional regulator with XRE-family HTH domain